MVQTGLIMSSRIHAQAAVPVSDQLRSKLTLEIERGRYAKGSRLPSERELAVKYGTSRTTVRQAIAELVRNGVLRRAVGKGTFVAPDGESASPPGQAATRTKTIAYVISEDIQNFIQAGYNRILLGARKACQENGYSLLFHSVTEDEAGIDAGIDGCIVAGGAPRWFLESMRAGRIPLVLADLLLLDENASSIGFDYAGGMREAILYLHGLGHRQIGFVGFPNSEKYVAYWQTLAGLGITYDPRFVEFLQLPDLQPSILSGYRTMQKMFAGNQLPTALIATNDLVAYGMMEALAIAGISVPEHISVLGFDDLDQDARPALTTIRTDSAKVGRLAVRSLLDQIQGGVAKEERIAVPTELLVRASTAPPAGRG
jgi:LacI family transcriptional regulator